jgi:hypothetical protein
MPGLLGHVTVSCGSRCMEVITTSRRSARRSRRRSGPQRIFRAPARPLRRLRQLPLTGGLFRRDYFRPTRHTLMPDRGDSKSMLRTRIVIDRVRKDGLVFASDYSDCDHSMEGFRKVMFRAKGVAPLKTGAAYSLECQLPPPNGGGLPPGPLAGHRVAL